MAKTRPQWGFKNWYKKHSSWLGWVGLVLLGATFLAKEVLPKTFESQAADAERAVTTLDTDDAEKRQVANTRSYGTDRADFLESTLVRMEESYKFGATDGYYLARIERLNQNESGAHTSFLQSRHITVEQLQTIAKTIYSRSFAAIANIGQLRKAKARSDQQIFGVDLDTFSKRLADDAHGVYTDESLLENFLNDWASAQRKSLETRRAEIKQKARLSSSAEYVLFAIGWFIAIGDKLVGKRESVSLVE